MYRIFNIRYGGLAFYGVVLAGVIAALLSQMEKIRSSLFDYLVVYIPLGQRSVVGVIFNQEAFGRNTLLPWGMISNGTADYLLRTGTGIPSLPVHPTFLYESLNEHRYFLVLLKVRRLPQSVRSDVDLFCFIRPRSLFRRRIAYRLSLYREYDVASIAALVGCFRCRIRRLASVCSTASVYSLVGAGVDER